MGSVEHLSREMSSCDTDGASWQANRWFPPPPVRFPDGLKTTNSMPVRTKDGYGNIYYGTCMVSIYHPVPIPVFYCRCVLSSSPVSTWSLDYYKPNHSGWRQCISISFP